MITDINVFLDKLRKKENFCYVRYNDGEMMGVDKVGSVAARGDQYITQELHEKLVEGINHRQENYYIGTPCSLCFPRYSALAKQIINDYKCGTSAVLFTNRNWKTFYDNFPFSCKDRQVVWVGGKSQSKQALIDYGLDIKNCVLIPEKNSWSYYEKIKTIVPPLLSPNDIVMVSLGPTARVLCKEWFQQYPENTFIDIGSVLDPVTKNVYFGAHKGWDETGFNLQKRCVECN
jgi:hypothetical protein